MTKRAGGFAEIRQRRNQSCTKMPGPDVIHRHARGERMASLGQPFGEGQSPATAHRGIGGEFTRLVCRGDGLGAGRFCGREFLLCLIQFLRRFSGAGGVFLQRIRMDDFRLGHFRPRHGKRFLALGSQCCFRRLLTFRKFLLSGIFESLGSKHGLQRFQFRGRHD